MTDDTFQATFNTAGPDSIPPRRRLGMGQTFGGDRDTYETLGYTEDLTVEDYWERYLRQDIARTIVDKPATTTWKEQPEVSDDADGENQTDFESDVETLFREKELLSRFDAVDRLAGIGHFGLLILGVADGRELSEPVASGRLSSTDDLAYIMPVAEDRVEEWELVRNEQDERFGLPEKYKVDLSSRDRLGNTTTLSNDSNVKWVHHERVIHVPAGNTLDNILMGRPRLEAVYNRLEDLEKVVGASSEMMWRAADYGLALKADPEHAGKLGKSAKEDIEEEMQKWYHGMQPFLRLTGFDVEKLGGENPSPEGIFDSLLKLIAGECGIPQRILTGSERGELASTQDRASWLGDISERQTNFAEPRIFRAFVDRMTSFGIVSEPTAGDGEGRDYDVDWPDLFELSETEQAEIASKLSTALKNARDPGDPDPIMTKGEKREVVFKIDPELGAETDLDEEIPSQDDTDPLADLLPEDGGEDVPDEDESGDVPDDEDGEDDEEPPIGNVTLNGEWDSI